MVREKKNKIFNIEKLHELIDSASLPKYKNTSSYNDKNLESLLNRLSDEPSKSNKKVTSSNLIHTKSESLTPRVVVHKREDIQKKEERVIQIELGPKAITKQKEHAIVGFAPPREDLFAEESLYEIEKIAFLEEEPVEVKPTDISKKSEVQQEFIQVVSDWEHKEKHLPEWEPVTKETTEKEIVEVKKGKSIEMFLPEFERVDEKQSPLPSRSPEKESRIPSFEPVEFEAVREEKQQVERSEVRKKEKAELLRKKLEEKQAQQEAKEKEREAKRLAKEHEEKLRLERLELRKKEKAELLRKKLEEKQAQQEAKEKEREAKRLAKEHDEKLQLEQLEIQKEQREEQKRKDLEKKKAAAEAKEKDLEEQRLIKEREEKLRLERLELRKKEKEKQKPRKSEKEKKSVVTTLVDQKKSARGETTNVGAARIKQKQIRKKPLLAQKDEQPMVSGWETLSEETHKEDAGDIPTELKEPFAHETIELISKEKEREQKRLEKEQDEKKRLERLELKRKEKEELKRKKLQEKQRADLFALKKEDKEQRKQKNLEEKQAKQEAKEREREEERRAKAELKSKQHILALKELEWKTKKKEEQKLKELGRKKEKKRLSELGIIGTAKETGLRDERKKAEEQKYTMDLVKIAAEVKEQRKLKAFERKNQKERKKTEKEKQKLKAIEENKARKKMDLHLEEEIVKEKLSGQVERIDIFVGFDSIDQETANLLLKCGYTSIEKLREASVKELMKIGLKKKIAQMILAESGEFVEWEVYDADEHLEKI
jgi:hypothetical protein